MKSGYQNTAKFYDIDYENKLNDVEFYIKYANKTGNNILELGCGTGRCSIEFAKRGINVTALDLSDQMLEEFKKKLEKEDCKDKITIIKGNMADFDFEKKHGLIISPYRAFQALTNKQYIENALHCIYKNLDDNGLFIINVGKVDENLPLQFDKEFIVWEQDFENNHIIKTTKFKKMDKINKVIYLTYTFYIMGINGENDIINDEMELRYYNYEELKDILQNNGFDVVEEYGNYDGLGVQDGDDIIFVCSKKSK